MTPYHLNFHGVGDPPPGVDQDEAVFWLTPPQFELAIDLMLAAGVPFEVSFDDGNRSDIEISAPLLKAKGVAAEFYVCSDRLGQQSYLDKADLRWLVGNGFLVGSHGCGHVDWRTCDSHTLDREIAESCRAIDDVIGRRVTAVALPFGSYDRRVLNALRRHGIERVLSCDGAPSQFASSPTPRFSLRGDLAIERQIKQVLSGRSLMRRLWQDARVCAKSSR